MTVCLKLQINLAFKKKENCFVCGKPDCHAPQCKYKMNDNPSKIKTKLARGNDMAMFVSQFTNGLFSLHEISIVMLDSNIFTTLPY